MKKTADPYQLNPTVTRWLASNFDPCTRVVELGGGAGTLDLVKHFKAVTTVEHDPTFAKFLTAARCKVLRVELRAGWYQTTPDLIDTIADAQLLIVDGPTGWRRENIRHHLHLITPGTVVVWDDVHRLAMAALVEDLEWPVLESFQDGPRRTLINRKP